MSDPNALPLAGWYPDPENEAGDRWWNGATWSDHRRPRNAPAGWAPTAKKSKKATAEAEPAVASPVPVPAAAPVVAPPNPYAGTAQPGYAPAQPAYQPYAPAYAPNYAPAQPMRNGLAMGGMITSLVALLFNFILFGAPGIAGAIVSIIGLRKANTLIREGVTVGNGKAMAITGIVTGFAGALLWDLLYFSTISPIYLS